MKIEKLFMAFRDTKVNNDLPLKIIARFCVDGEMRNDYLA